MNKLIPGGGDYSQMPAAEYGFDAYGNKVKPIDGFELIKHGDELRQGDSPFDVYAGWLESSFYNSDYHHTARSRGRWTTWQRPK